MEGLFVILLVLIFVVGVPVMVYMRKQANEAWGGAAKGLGMRFEAPSMFGARKITGTVDGFRVTVDTFTRSSGKSSTTYTRFKVRYPESLRLGLKLTREGFFSGFAKRLGSQDIELGDAAFDPDVMVKGRDPLAVRRFLTPARRLRVHRFLSTYRGATIDDQGIEWHTQGVFRESTRIVRMVKSMTGLAWHLAGDRATDTRVHRALEERNAGRPERALEILADPAPGRKPRPEHRREAQSPEMLGQPGREATPEEPAVVPPLLTPDERPPEERVLEGELLLLTGREDEARDAFEAAHRQAPDDPEIREWVTPPGPAETTESAPRDGSDGAADPVPEAAAEPPPLDVETVCAALFGDDASSYQVTQRFEGRYRGCEVHWSGLLLEVESYAFDAVFGSDSGTRAVVVVYDTESGVFGESKVYAVVQLPPEAVGELIERRGHDVAFRGRLVKVDSMMRNLYVADGSLVTPGD